MASVLGAPRAAPRAASLDALIRPLRAVDNRTNWLYIAAEHATLATVLVSTVLLVENHARLGFHWAIVPFVVAAAWVLIAACQHRLMGLGHEGSHYILFKNRVLNELASDLLCMFPVLATTEHYRQVHLGHHEFVNDWERDPELINLGKTRGMDAFPMDRWRYLRSFGSWLIWPPSVLRYMNDNFFTTILGMGRHPYMVEADAKTTGRFTPWRPATILGIVYLVVMGTSVSYLRFRGDVTSILLAAASAYAVALVAIRLMPREWFFRSQLKNVYSIKITSALRLGFFTALYTAFAVAENVTNHPWGVYFWLLWIGPMVTVLPHLMIHRDLFQHANCDDGRLTNARNMFTHPFIRWAMFVYGQDMHLTHHLCPAVPHYRLRRLDEIYRQNDGDYAENVIECHGVLFRGREDRPAILDTIDAEHVASRHARD